jgi:hypothetical protein
MHNLNREKSSPEMWATSVIVRKLPKESNENSPNLVTLFSTFNWDVKRRF